MPHRVKISGMWHKHSNFFLATARFPSNLFGVALLDRFEFSDYRSITAPAADTYSRIYIEIDSI